MSSVALAADLVARARRRLVARQAVELAVTGAFVVGVCSACVGLAGAAGWVPALAPALLLAPPVVGAIAGAALAAAGAPDRAAAALAVDRAAGAHEAFVSALTATDAAPTMRELSAAYGLSAVAGRPLRSLLPFDVPARTAPAAIARARTAAIVALGAPPESAAADPAKAPDAALAGGAAGAGQDADAQTSDTGAEPGASSPVPDAAGTRPGAVAALPEPRPEDLPELSTDDVRALAEDLAARGVEAGAQALAALAAGDRAAAETLLRAALAARGDGTGAGTGAPAADAGTRVGPRAAPGRWSVGDWPLRYDREVRAWLRRQVADDGRTHPKGDER